MNIHKWIYIYDIHKWLYINEELTTLYMTQVHVTIATAGNPSFLYFVSDLWSSLNISPKLKWLILIPKAKSIVAAVRNWQKQPFRSVSWKRCSEKMLQIHKKTPTLLK